MNIRTNPKNDRAKREYLIYLKDARQRSSATVEQVRHAIDRLEGYTGFKDFGTFNKDQARGFKRALVATKGRRSGKPISSATAHHVLWALKEFFLWLHCQPSYRRRINLSDVAYLSLTANEERAAHTGRPKSYASLDQYRAALFVMPTDTEDARRDQALFALLLLTAMRDAAAVSLKLKHISIERGYVFQDPREVRTKFAKAINTFFCPVGKDVAAIVLDWVDYLTTKKLFGPDDPLFPKTAIRQDEHHSFTAQGLTRQHWANASPVREIFRTAFARVGLPYVKPHSVRDTLTQLAYKLELKPEELKAWSQNLGHESLLTTLGSYGPVSIERQAEIMSSVGRSDIAAGDIETRIAEKVAAILKGEQPPREGLQPREFKAWSQNMGHNGVLDEVHQHDEVWRSGRRTSSDRWPVRTREGVICRWSRRSWKLLSRLERIDLEAIDIWIDRYRESREKGQ